MPKTAAMVIVLICLLSGAHAATLTAPETVKTEQYPPLRFLTEHSPPGMYLDNNGHVAGVTAELIRVLQQRLQESAEIELMPWARAFEIARHQTNIALFETARSSERESWFKWVGPLKLVQTALYGHRSRFDADASAQTLSARLIACDYVNSLNVSFLHKIGFEEKRNLILTNKHGECFNLFISGKVDLLILNDSTAYDVEMALKAAGKSGLFRVNTLRETQLYLAFSQDVSDERVAAWQQALEQSYRDGTMRQLYQQVYSDAEISRLEQVVLPGQLMQQHLLFQQHPLTP